MRIIHNGIVGGRITGIFGGIQLVLAAGSGDDFLCPGVAAPVDVRCRVIVLFFSASIRGAATQLGSVNAPLTITVCGILQGNGIAVALLLTDTGGGVIGGIVFVMTGMEHDGDNVLTVLRLRLGLCPLHRAVGIELAQATVAPGAVGVVIVADFRFCFRAVIGDGHAHILAAAGVPRSALGCGHLSMPLAFTVMV